MFSIYAFAAMWLLRNTDLMYPRHFLLTYNYVYLQILRILDFWEGTDYFRRYHAYFVLPKTRSKVWLNDQRWSHVVDKINKDRENLSQSNWRNRPWPKKPLYTFIYG